MSINPVSRYHTEQKSYSCPASGMISDQGWEKLIAYCGGIGSGIDYDGRFTSSSIKQKFEGFRDRAVFSFDLPEGIYIPSSCRPVLNTAYHSPEQAADNVKAYLKQCESLVLDSMEFRKAAGTFTGLVAVVRGMERQWLVTGKGDYVGTFPKRLSRRLFKEYSIKVPPQVLQSIGNLLDPYIDRKECQVVLAFDQDYTGDSNPSDYCHGDSCWWGSGRAGVREGFALSGGYAIRQFEDAKPKSRCWIVWQEHLKVYVLMNAYGQLKLAEFARLLATAWGMSYAQKSIDAVNLHDTDGKYVKRDDGSYFINQNNCYVIGETADIEALRSCIDARFHEKFVKKIACRCCSSLFSEDMAHHVAYVDEDIESKVCPNCSFCCYDCGIYRPTTQSVETQGKKICTKCASKYTKCRFCESLVLGREACSGCMRKHGLVPVYVINWDSSSYVYKCPATPATVAEVL